MNIFEALRREHEIQRELADKLIETSGESKERKDLYKKLKHELKIHANGEERFFYKPLFDYSQTQEHARHGVAEHHEMDEIMEKMDDTEMSSPGWLALAKDLHHKVFHHLEDEEHGIFQVSGRVLSENQKTDLAKEYNNYIEQER